MVPTLVDCFLADIGLAWLPHHITGAWRRGLSECDEIELVLIILKDSQLTEVKGAIKRVFGRVGAEDEPRMSAIFSGIQFNLHIVDLDHLGSMMLHTTGSGQFLQLMQARAKAKGWELNQHGLFELDSGKELLPSMDEVYFLHVLGMSHIEAENRSEGCEFELKSLDPPHQLQRYRLVEKGWDVVG